MEWQAEVLLLSISCSENRGVFEGFAENLVAELDELLPLMVW